MRVVWKYQMERPVGVFDLPADAEIVHVAPQDNTPTMWVLLDPDAARVTRTFLAAGTGTKVRDNARYVGTATGIDGWLVFHIFEGAA